MLIVYSAYFFVFFSGYIIIFKYYISG